MRCHSLSARIAHGSSEVPRVAGEKRSEKCFSLTGRETLRTLSKNAAAAPLERYMQQAVAGALDLPPSGP